MFRAARKHLRAIGLIGVASALVVGGVAAAQGDQGKMKSTGSDSITIIENDGSEVTMPPPPGAELHVER